jgi:hypothetical protein
MMPLLRKVPNWPAAIACLTLGAAIAVAQVTEDPQQPDNAFKGIHRNLGRNGGPETVTITEGKTYERVTEQEYRERDYAPDFAKLPTQIIQRLPGRFSVPPERPN